MSDSVSGWNTKYWKGQAERAQAALADKTDKVAEIEPIIADLLEALEDLEQAEATYRKVHDLYGSGDMKTGRARDLMRRFGDKSRAAIAKATERRAGK